jgi:glycosyltransferase involved in cell wall biosynthesis
MSWYTLITFKRLLEELIMFPFVMIGKVIAAMRPLGEEYDYFMFFPIYGIGGAEKVNADILSALPDKKIIIFFTRKSPNDKLLHLFERPNITTRDISQWTDNKWMYWANLVYRGICARHINSQKKTPIVFNGQCNFAYKLFPHLRKGVYKVELIHNSLKKFAWVTFPYVPFIDVRVMITKSIIAGHTAYYRELGIPKMYEERIVNITNCVDVPDSYHERATHDVLKVYYAGRGGYQKRLEVLFEVVRQCLTEGLRMEFHFAGTFEEELPADIKNKIVWHGSISRKEDMERLHAEMDVLLMTSRFEGFPLVMMEAMGWGAAVVATAVDGIPEHITDGMNGFLLRQQDATAIVKEAIGCLETLCADKQLLQNISRNNYEYARMHFTRDVFEAAYRRVLRG